MVLLQCLMIIFKLKFILKLHNIFSLKSLFYGAGSNKNKKKMHMCLICINAFSHKVYLFEVKDNHQFEMCGRHLSYFAYCRQTVQYDTRSFQLYVNKSKFSHIYIILHSFLNSCIKSFISLAHRISVRFTK